MPRPARSFSRRVLLSQLAVVVVLLALVTGVFAWLGARAVTDVSETEALTAARTLASTPSVREGSTRASQEHAATPDSAITGPLQELTEDLRERAGLQFAVITDDRGIRLTHPNPEEIGRMVSSSPEEALAGREAVTHGRGTLGETVRAKVPVYSSTGEGTVVGEVSVGIHASVLDADLRREFLALGSVAVLALAVGVLASLALGRRLRRETLGVGPEELAEMARDQGAVLRGLDDGVLGFSSRGELTLSNARADELLGARPEATGEVPAPLRRMMAEAPDRGALRRRVNVEDRILLATAVRVSRGGVSVGGVVTLRDETQMLTMSRQLESVTTMAQALRAQRHEFANRLHTVLGLVDTGATEEARGYLATILRTGPIAAPVEGIELVSDPYLRALLEAKGTTAAEAGVALAVTPDSLVLGRVRDPEDVTLILGNLIDNAVRAVVRGRAGEGADAARAAGGPPGREAGGPAVSGRDDVPDPPADAVEVQLLSSGSELHAVVTDTGGGVAPGDAERIFEEGISGAVADDSADPDPSSISAGRGAAGPVHGLGIGLALCRRVAQRHGGRVWLLDGRDPVLGGASFGVRLPEVLEGPGAGHEGGSSAPDDDADEEE
ncbi:ATP-binding protein [Rothia sp. AR01]|uniref:histidine kinase n=1 Tax=Rothia santali TaxID=2949643 RepID=A0A9X2HC07_9MICC|nr:ATP-binding protein [Rothia santali]MCP3426576.1 ATP-binding protein [Rothia santali]